MIISSRAISDKGTSALTLLDEVGLSVKENDAIEVFQLSFFRGIWFGYEEGWLFGSSQLNDGCLNGKMLPRSFVLHPFVFFGVFVIPWKIQGCLLLSLCLQSRPEPHHL